METLKCHAGFAVELLDKSRKHFPRIMEQHQKFTESLKIMEDCNSYYCHMSGNISLFRTGLDLLKIYLGAWIEFSKTFMLCFEKRTSYIFNLENRENIS